MNTSRVLHSHHTVKPDLLSMNPGQHLYHQPPIMAALKHTQNLCPPADFARGHRFSNRSPLSPYVPAMPRSPLQKYSFRAAKKRVVFADEVGLPLTTERLFTPEPSCPPPAPATPPCPRRLEGQQNPANKFQLSFSEPTKDFDTFAAHLQDQCVQLKSCNITDSLLSGEVCVFHSSPKKTLNMKVFYDQWKSPMNISCKFLGHKILHGLDVALFSFEVYLPQDTLELIQFCFTISPEHSSALHRYDNVRQNYTVFRGKTTLCDGNGSKKFYSSLSNYRRTVGPQWQPSLQTVIT